MKVVLMAISVAIIVYFLTKAIVRPNPDTIITAAAISLAGVLIIYVLSRRPAGEEFRRSHVLVALGLVLALGIFGIAIAIFQSGPP